MFKYVMAALIVMVFIGGILSFIETKTPELSQHKPKAEAPGQEDPEALGNTKSQEENQAEKMVVGRNRAFCSTR